MARALYVNNATTSLSISASAVDTTLTVANGSVFPTPTGGNYVYLTLSAPGGNEIVKLTGRTGNVLTVVRGQDNTVASSFSSGSTVSLRVVAALFDELQAGISLTETTLQADIDTRATITQLNTVESTLTGSIATVSTALTAETTARTNADTALQTDINTRATATELTTVETNLTSAIASSATTLTAAYTAADAAVTSAYQSADSGLQGQINTNASDISAAEANITTLQSATASNTGAIATLQTNLSAEVTNRTNADTTLQGQITTNTGNIATNAAAITTEATARASGDAANATSITNLSASVTKLAVASGPINVADVEYFTNSRNGDPLTVGNVTSYSATVVNDSSIGRALRSTFTFSGQNVLTKQLFEIDTNKTYKVRIVYRVSTLPLDGTANLSVIVAGVVPASSFSNPASTFSPTFDVSVTTRQVAEFTISSAASSSTNATYPGSGSTHFRVGLRQNTNETSAVDIATIEVFDVTDTVENTADITTLQSTTATNTSAISTLTTNLSAEVTNRTNADTTLQGQITTNAAAITTEATARANADSALATSVTNLTATVNTKARTFVQTSAPTATATGDLWVDSDDNNKLYRWSGSSWVAVDDGRIATKARTFAQTSAPTATAAGDLWVDTDANNKLYRWSGSSWVAVDDGRIATVSASVNNIAEAYATNSSATARLVWTVNTSTNAATITQTAHTGYSDGTWNGSAIKLSADLIELLAKDINFGTNTTYEDTYATLYTTKNNKRLRILGPFPATDDIVLWFGPTTVALNSESKTNGHFCLATDGKVYYGNAELSSGVSVNDKTVSKVTSGLNTTTSGTTWIVASTLDMTVGTPGNLRAPTVGLVGDPTMTLSAGSTFNGEWRVTEATQAAPSTKTILYTGTFTAVDTGGGLFDFTLDGPDTNSLVSATNSGACRYTLEIRRAFGTNNITGGGANSFFAVEWIPAG